MQLTVNQYHCQIKLEFTVLVTCIAFYYGSLFGSSKLMVVEIRWFWGKLDCINNEPLYLQCTCIHFSNIYTLEYTNIYYIFTDRLVSEDTAT